MSDPTSLRSAGRRLVAAGLLCVSTLGAGAPMPAAEEPEVPLEELGQRPRDPAREVELERQEAAPKPVVALGEEGFAVKTADGAFAIKLRALLQVDGLFFGGDQGGADRDTFQVSRARPILEATAWRIFDFRFMPEFGAGATSIQDAYVEARLAPAAKLRVGKFRPPVGLERLQSAADLTFVARALPTNLVPNRDIGVQLAGDLASGRVGYAVGLFNGTADGASADAEVGGDPEAAARLFLRPFAARDGDPGPDLGIGLAATYGDETGTPAATGLPRYRSSGQQTFFAYRSDGTAAGTAIAAGRRFRLAPQGWFYAGPFGALAEWTRARQEVARDGEARTLSHESWQITLSWVATGERASYAGVRPDRPFRIGGPGRGAVILSLRVHGLAIDPDAFPDFAAPERSAREAMAIGVGVSWDLARRIRLMLDGERTEFTGGAAQGADRASESALFLRCQFAL